MHPSLIIFWKDCRRLWPAALAFVAIQLCFDAELVALVHGARWVNTVPLPVLPMGSLSVLTVAFIMFGMVVSLFWSDPVGDPAASWRTRPVTGLQLLGAKMMGVAALVWMPYLAVGLAWWLWIGFGADVMVKQALVASSLVAFLSVLAATTAMFSRRKLGLLLSTLALVVAELLLVAGLSELYRKIGHRVVDGGILHRACLLSGMVGLGIAQIVWHASPGRSRRRALIPGGILGAAMLGILLFGKTQGENMRAHDITVTEPTWGGDLASTTLTLKIAGLGPSQFVWPIVSGRFPIGTTKCLEPIYPGNRWVQIEQALAEGRSTSSGTDAVEIRVSNPSVLSYQESGDEAGRGLRKSLEVSLPEFDGTLRGRIVEVDALPSASFSADQERRTDNCMVLVRNVTVSDATDRIEFGYSILTPAQPYEWHETYVVDRAAGRAYPASTLARGRIDELAGAWVVSGRFYVPLSRMHPGPFGSEKEKFDWVRSLSVVTVMRRDLGWFSRRFVVPAQRLTVPLRSQTERHHPLAGQSLPRE